MSLFLPDCHHCDTHYHITCRSHQHSGDCKYIYFLGSYYHVGDINGCFTPVLTHC